MCTTIAWLRVLILKVEKGGDNPPVDDEELLLSNIYHGARHQIKPKLMQSAVSHRLVHPVNFCAFGTCQDAESKENRFLTVFLSPDLDSVILQLLCT